MINPVTVTLTFYLAVAILCLVKPNTGRIFLGLFFLAMAIGINIPLALLYPHSYVELGRHAFIPFYRWIFLDVVALNPALFVLPIAAYQIAIGVLILYKKKYVKIGLIGGIIFLLGITPIGIEELTSPVLALVLAGLLRQEFDPSFLETLRSSLHLRPITPISK